MTPAQRAADHGYALALAEYERIQVAYKGGMATYEEVMEAYYIALALYGLLKGSAAS